MRGDLAFDTPSGIRARTAHGASIKRQKRTPRIRLGLRELDRLARLPGGPLLILRGDCLVRHGHPFYDLYALCSGLIEARITDASDYVRVLAQYRPGDVIGLDALHRGNYPADFLALESSTVCTIPLSMMDEYLRLLAAVENAFSLHLSAHAVIANKWSRDSAGPHLFSHS